jgi:hypothetical protein
MSFISEAFAASNNNAGSYFKPAKDSTSKVRIVSEKGLEGYVCWTEDNKPVRWHWRDNKPEANYREGDKPRKFLAVAVWNYNERCVQVWEITQKSVFDALFEITKDPDFGHPSTFDIKITRKGEGLETKYNVMPVPGPIVPDVEAAMQTLSCNLEALLTNDDPFA